MSTSSLRQDTETRSATNHAPATQLSQRALALASKTLSEPIFNHSLRVFIFAKWLAAQEQNPIVNDEHQLDLLFAACICHDFGSTAEHDGLERFECCGADAAVSFLDTEGVNKHDSHAVWTAIALHTSPGIAERIDPFTRLVRMGVLLDFRPATREALNANEFFEQIIQVIPRLDIEKHLGDAVVAQAIKNPSKAPAASWPGVLLRSHTEDPSWSGVNRAF